MFLGIEIKDKRYGLTLGESEKRSFALENDSEKRSFTLENDSESARKGLGILLNDTYSGANVTGDLAMGLAPVFSSVRVVSEDLASVSCNVVHTDKNGSRENDKNHPVYKLLQKPNDYQTPFTFTSNLTAITNLWGNGISLIHRDGLYRPAELEIIHPSDVEGFEVINRKIWYKVKQYNQLLSSDDVIHIAGPGWDGIAGMSMIKYHRENFGLGIAAQQFGGAFFRNGASLQGILSTDAILKEEQVKVYTDSWNAKYAGAGNSNKTAVLGNGLKYQSIGIPPEDAQFIETRKFTRSEIAGIFRVPAHMINDNEKSAYANIEQASINYVVYSLRPWAERFEQELTRKLFTEKDKQYYSIKFNLNALLRGDAASRMQYLKDAINSGILSPNEARYYEGFNNYDGGDERFIMSNMMPMSQANDFYKTKTVNTNTDGNTNK